jgi:predicted secreted Zn-dependent protease
LRVQQRAGHEDFDTTQVYIREAENLSCAIGEVSPALPASVIKPEISQNREHS